MVHVAQCNAATATRLSDRGLRQRVAAPEFARAPALNLSLSHSVLVCRQPASSAGLTSV